jgi:hypothetical protein
MPGRPREPAKLIKLKGNKHYTKAWIDEKEEKEINVVPNGCLIPEGLTDEQRDLYIDTYNNLNEYGLITHFEIGLLTRYVKARTEYNRLSAVIESIPVDGEYIKLMNGRLKVSDELRRCEVDLGLNIFARMKFTAPPKEEPPKTQAEELFGEL